MPLLRRFSPPFKDLVGTEVEAGAWHYRADSGDLLAVDEGIPGWDYLKRLEFHREIKVDGAAGALACDLPDAARIALVVTARSPSARFRRVVFQSAALPKSLADVVVRFTLDGSALSRELELDTEILLVDAATTKKALVATLPGSRLFSSTTRIDLEGSGSRMPVEIVDLASQVAGLVAPGARWHVLVETTDLHAPVMRSLRVFLNARDTRVIDAARAGDTLVLSVLAADVARRLLATALDDDDFMSDPDDFESGTTGEAARRILRLCFPGLSPVSVRALAVSDPARFESIVQSGTKLADG